MGYLRLFHEIKRLLAAHHRGGFASVGIDTWGVDFGLIDASDKLLENPIHYRDRRTEAAIEKLKDLISPTDLFKRTGIEPTFFNTIYQLYSLVTQRPELLARAETALLTPDLLACSNRVKAPILHRLNDRPAQPLTRTWDNDLFKNSVCGGLFPPVVPPAQSRQSGDDVCHELGIELTGYPHSVTRHSVGCRGRPRQRRILSIFHPEHGPRWVLKARA